MSGKMEPIVSPAMPESYRPELSGNPLIDDCRMARALLKWVHSDEYGLLIKLQANEMYNALREGRERATAPQPVIQPSEPETLELESKSANTYVVHKFDHTQPTGFKHVRITLPLLSIQRSPS